MALKTRLQLKAFFETGDFPTQSEFSDFIDSILNFKSDGISEIKSVTKTFADFQPAGVGLKIINLFPFLANQQVLFIIMKPTVSFNGSGITNAQISVYNSDDTLRFSHLWNVDVFSAITNQSGAKSDRIESNNLGLLNSAGGHVRLELDVWGLGTENIDDLTQGSITFYYRLIDL